MENLHDIFNIVVGVIIADLGVSWIRRCMKRRHMRKLNQLSQIKRRKKKEEVIKIIKETEIKTNVQST